jgi:hypothetical protein
MSTTKPFIQPGATVWILTRDRIRSGEGPRQVAVAELSDGLFRTAGTRGWFSPCEAFQHEADAHAQWRQAATAEHAAETDRYNKIAARLMAWQDKVAAA